MSVLKWLLTEINEVPENHYLVVHPFDDVPEDKVDTSSLGAMPMTRTVRLSLLGLWGYLVLMMLLVLYHVIDREGAFALHTQ
jgi:hypothetical protein